MQLPTAGGMSASAGGSGNAFLPNQLGSLAAWYRQGVGITSALGLVSQWSDQSGNARHLLQATETNQPTLQADNSILFDGADNYLKADAFTLNQPETIYVLGKQITWSGNDRWFDGNTTNAGSLFQSGSTPAVRISAGTIADSQAVTLNTYRVVTVIFNGASSNIFVNGTGGVAVNAGAANMSGFTLGAAGGISNYGHIQIKEVIIYSAAHDAATRARVIRYMMNKGGI